MLVGKNVFHSGAGVVKLCWELGFADVVGVVLGKRISRGAKDANPVLGPKIDLTIRVQNGAALAIKWRIFDKHEVLQVLHGA